jgi:hypothetical protein
MKKLDEQQLRTLAELPYNMKYADVITAAEEELNRRALNTKENLAKFENKYFISKSPTRTKVVKTSKWDKMTVGKYRMICKYVEFDHDDRPSNSDHRLFTIVDGKCSWYSDQKEYFEKNYTEITEEEWLKWVEKFKVFHSTMYKLKDWE